MVGFLILVSYSLQFVPVLDNEMSSNILVQDRHDCGEIEPVISINRLKENSF